MGDRISIGCTAMPQTSANICVSDFVGDLDDQKARSDSQKD
jgi:hypothetical protein